MTDSPTELNIAQYRYKAMIGVGGIGWGMVFGLNANHTLGREESRSGRFLDRQDYCKLHIISHYVQTLLGPEFQTYPVGKVGDDDTGRRLVQEMKEAGIRVDLVRRSPGDRTLFSFCFVYPDGDGGNLTTADSACAKVDAAFVAGSEPQFEFFERRGIALAVPEVPLDARRQLLALATKYHFFRAASFTSEEIAPAVEDGLLKSVDLLALNLDEAAALAGMAPDGDPAAIVAAAVETLSGLNPAMLASITAGPNGSWTWDGSALSHLPRLDANAVSTAGAGDAHFAGLIVGLVAGLPLGDAHQLGSLVAALSVTSPHTINKDIDRAALCRFAADVNAPLGKPVRRLLEDADY